MPGRGGAGGDQCGAGVAGATTSRVPFLGMIVPETETCSASPTLGLSTQIATRSGHGVRQIAAAITEPEAAIERKGNFREGSRSADCCWISPYVVEKAAQPCLITPRGALQSLRAAHLTHGIQHATYSPRILTSSGVASMPTTFSNHTDVPSVANASPLQASSISCAVAPSNPR